MDETLVTKAVAALQKYHSTLKKRSKPNLIEEDPLVSLVIALKKIPDRTIRPLRVPLPHSLYPTDTADLCLITKSEKDAVKELLQAKGVQGVSKIIPISKLKTSFKSFESKRQLSANYDLFLADQRLYQMLPRLLGKKFFEKKKFPIPVNMQKKDLLHEIQQARDSTYLYVGLGSCCNVPIGRLGFTLEQLVSNVTMGIKGVASHIPQGMRNIQSVHLKTPDSIALPIYNSLPPPPGLLPPVSDHTPAAKRLKLDSDLVGVDTDLAQIDTDLAQLDTDLAKSESESEDSVCESKRKRTVALESEMRSEFSSADGRDKARRRGSRGKRGGKLSKLSIKKVRGSTVMSSKYEKALRRKTRT